MTPPPRLLVVDDDVSIAELYRQLLTAEGYEVLTAGSCAQAMAQMDATGGAVAVLIVDIGLPDGDGSDFVRDSTAKHGLRPTIFVSGWSDDFWQLSDAPGSFLVMRKPVPIAQLLAAVRWLAYGGDKPPELS